MLSLRTWIISTAFFVSTIAMESAIFANDVDCVEPKENLSGLELHEQLRESLRLRDAIARGNALVETSVKNYPANRQCFSCHHQTLPLLSKSVKDRISLREAPNAFWDESLTQSVLNFTEESFSEKIALMQEGRGVGGKALTVAYGLWAMDLAGAKRNKTIEAMIDYLLKTQADDGAWNYQSVRPPAASSRSMTTAVAIYGLRVYGHDYVEPSRLQESFENARKWSIQANESESQEELNGMAWLDYMLHEERTALQDQMRRADLNSRTDKTKDQLASPSKPVGQRNELSEDLLRLRQRIERILKNQNDDGGWGQTADMPSDAYATGQTLLILAQVEYRDKKSIQSSDAFMKGIEFLLESQESDGSWHVATRAKPVQVFFDNGDPHGKDQFISIMATNWAIAALANFQAFGYDPLESFQVVHRRAELVR